MEESKSVTSFKVSGEYFAVETASVRHILASVPPTRVPLTKPFIKGVINNHGNMIPVIDFRALLGRDEADGMPEQSIVVVGIESNGKEEMVGFRVDEMDDVFETAPGAFSHDVVINVAPEVQRAVAGTIKEGDKFVYLLKLDELEQALL